MSCEVISESQVGESQVGESQAGKLQKREPPRKSIREKTLAFPKTSLLLSSDQTDWHNIHLEYHHEPAGKIGSFCLDQLHMLCIETTCRSCDAKKWMNQRFQSRPIIHGDVFVVPERVEFREEFIGEIEYILLYLDPDWIASIAHEIIDPDRVELLPHFPKPDQMIYQIGLALKSLLEINGSFSQLYAESLTTSLAVHLLHHYSGERSKLAAQPKHLHRFSSVIDYIHAYADRDLSLSELAAQAQMSLHYFARSFKQATGMSPHQYVIHCRIERAKQLLQQKDLTIVEIAQQVGFVDQSHFSRHFKDRTGVTPRQWMQQ